LAGQTTILSSLNVSGVTNLFSNVIISGNTQLLGTLIVTGTSILNDQTTILSSLIVSGFTNLQNTVIINGITTLNSYLNVNNDIYFSGNTSLINKFNSIQSSSNQVSINKILIDQSCAIVTNGTFNLSGSFTLVGWVNLGLINNNTYFGISSSTTNQTNMSSSVLGLCSLGNDYLSIYFNNANANKSFSVIGYRSTWIHLLITGITGSNLSNLKVYINGNAAALQGYNGSPSPSDSTILNSFNNCTFQMYPAITSGNNAAVRINNLTLYNNIFVSSNFTVPIMPNILPTGVLSSNLTTIFNISQISFGSGNNLNGLVNFTGFGQNTQIISGTYFNNYPTYSVIM
jgi:hypothetical protein